MKEELLCDSCVGGKNYEHWDCFIVNNSCEHYKKISIIDDYIARGYSVGGIHSSQEKNIKALNSMLKNGYELETFDKLFAKGYTFVEPSPFTKNFKLAYKEDEKFKYFSSNYYFSKGDEEIFIFIKHEYDEEEAKE